ncbi:MAG: hypothetical protein JWP36_2560 [Paucimonas sp.]|nr:hypothetical protein [Paucimonas sp.]
MSGKSRTRLKKQSIAQGRGLALPPRNLVAVAARQRVAGAHVKSVSAQRQRHKRALAKLVREES